MSKTHARAIDSVQTSLESEQKAKAETLRIKKKIDGDINEVEIALDHANKANMEAQKSIKIYQGQLCKTESGYEEEQCARQNMMEKVSLSEHRANALQGEMEETCSLLDSTERGKRQTEGESSEARNAVQEISAINSKASTEAKNSEEKAKKAMVNAARLADELPADEDHTNSLSSTKRALEVQFSELEIKYNNAIENAMRNGRGKA